ncbi:MAG: SDR family NAD(P)-dependent oxidoreductase [Pseudomonadales bacterium]
MSSRFAIPDHRGKRVLITGASQGVGFHVATALAQAGVNLILTEQQRGDVAALVSSIRRFAPQVQVQVVSLDLADLSSVERCTEQLSDQGAAIDMLINNAAQKPLRQRALSVQGYELQWATNHLGHVALTRGLLALLELSPAGRVVTLSSFRAARRKAAINFCDVNSETRYCGDTAYTQSKLANLLFAIELQLRLKRSGSRVISVAAQPGLCHPVGESLKKLRQLDRALIGRACSVGAQSVLLAAAGTDIAGGEYIGPRGLTGLCGDPQKNTLPNRAQDDYYRTRLWRVTEQCLACEFLPFAERDIDE